MPQQTINIGSAPDDGTGDTLRVGGDKINDNFTELYTDYMPKAGGTFTGDIVVPDEAYDATAWNGSLEAPTKNAVRDKIESLGSGITELDDIPDVNAPTPSNGDVLTWDSTPGEWVSAAPTGGSNALDDLTDVDAPTPNDGDVLTFDSGSGDWVPEAPAGSSFQGALVTKASDQTTADYSAGAVVGWDSETYDVGGWHESVTNPSWLTVPSGVSLVSIVGEIHLNNVTAGNLAQIALIKNGSAIDTDVGMPVQTAAPNNTTRRINIASPVLQVSPGDYFQMHLTVNADSSVTVEATSSWLAIRAV